MFRKPIGNFLVVGSWKKVRISLVIPLLVSALVLTSGCSKSGPELFSVSGTVTLQGQPLPNVIVTFIPDDGGKSASGTGDSAGNYKLSTFAPNDGALAGSYKVAIMPKDPPPMAGEAVSSPGASTEKPKKYTPPFPARYGLPKDSGLTANVSPNGENKFNFDLKMK